MKNKESKARYLAICSAILFVVMLFAEFYTSINYPKGYMALVLFAVGDLLCLFGTIYAVFIIREQKELRREEQYDSIFKSEKASYLMLRKYFDEIVERLEKIENQQATSNISQDDVINAQKAAAKIIISRNKENADAILAAIDQFTEELGNVQSANDAGSAKVAEGQLKEILLALKDMELRINAAIMQCQSSIAQASAPVSVVTPMAAPVMAMQSAPVQVEAPILQEAPIQQETLLQPEDIELPEEAAMTEELILEEDITEEPLMEEPLAEEEALMEEPLVEEALVEEPLVEEALVEEPLVEEPPVEEPLVEDAPLVEEPLMEEPLIEEEPVPEEPVVEEKPPMPDLSDPNKVMTPEEIAALIANI